MILSKEEVGKLPTKSMGLQYQATHNPDFVEMLGQLYPDLPFKEQLYLYKTQSTAGTCKACGKKTRFINGSVGYAKYCCSKCSNSDPDKIKLQQKSTMDHYGVTNPSQNKEVQQKKLATCNSNYGGYGSDAIKAKRRNTCMERYGDPTYKGHEKAQQTCLEKYGSISPMGNQDVQRKSHETKLERYGSEFYNNPDKIASTCLERYGVVRFANTDQAKQTKFTRYGDENYNNREQAQQTCLERYGDENYNNREQAQQTCLERYGCATPMQNSQVKEKAATTMLANQLNAVSELIGYTDEGLWICSCPHPECKQCQSKTYTTHRSIHYDRKRLGIELCTTLLNEKVSHNSGTTIELFVRNILDTHNVKYEVGNRTILDGKELDIYIPDKNIAIECNGIFFHSTRRQPDYKYHYKKWKLCSDKKIQLITVWEDQIKTNPHVVESIILSKLCIYNTRIFARKCIVRQMSYIETEEFLIRNHIQGSMKPSISLGLIYNDEVVSIMTFNKKRGMMGNHKTTDEYELSRFCNKTYTQVIGGASKLFKYFLNNYEYNIVYSFSSNDISNGGLYEILGFSQVGTNNSYWYIDGSTMTRQHRSQFSKQSIVNKHIKDKIDDSWTESSATYELGLYQIYDCGQIKWEYKKRGANY